VFNWLAEAQIAEADFLAAVSISQRTLRGARVGKVAQKPDDFFHGRVEEIGDTPFVE